MHPATESTVVASPAIPAPSPAKASTTRPTTSAPAAKPAAGRRLAKTVQAGTTAVKPAKKRAAAKTPAPQSPLVVAAAPTPAAKTPPVQPSTAVKPLTKKRSKAAAHPVAALKPKAKLVRDSFTMPQSDFDLIAVLKDRALGFKRPTKKSELLRAGLQVLAGLGPDTLKTTLERLAPLKTGRPRKGS